MGDHHVKILRAWEEVDALRDEWDDLATRTGCTTIFHTGLATLGMSSRREPEGSPLVVTARGEDARLTAVLPLRSWCPRPGLLRRRLESLAGWHASSFDMLAESDRAALAAWTSVDRVLPSRDDAIDLRRVPEGSRLHRLHGGPWTPDGMLKRVEFSGGAHRSPRDLAKKLRRMQRLGQVVFEARTPHAELPAVVTTFIALHGARWRDVPGAAEFNAAAQQERLSWLLSEATRRGIARVGSLRIDGRMVAIHLAFRWGTTQYSWRIASSADHPELSPGMVLYDLMLQNAADEGCDTAELGRGTEEYKDRWHPVTVPLWRTIVHGATWRGRAAALRQRWSRARD